MIWLLTYCAAMVIKIVTQIRENWKQLSFCIQYTLAQAILCKLNQCHKFSLLQRFQDCFHFQNDTVRKTKYSHCLNSSQS